MSPTEKAYAIANNAIYFDDNADYIRALWEILYVLNPTLEEYPKLDYIEIDYTEEVK